MSKKKIMIVDDDADLAEEIAQVLKEEGYRVAVFTSSVEAGHRIGEVMPDLALLDLRMSGRSGFDLANAISHRPETSHIPVIAMSGYYDEDKYKGLMQIVGIRELLKKPFRPEQLLRILDGLLGCSEQPGPGQDEG